MLSFRWFSAPPVIELLAHSVLIQMSWFRNNDLSVCVSLGSCQSFPIMTGVSKSILPIQERAGKQAGSGNFIECFCKKNPMNWAAPSMFSSFCSSSHWVNSWCNWRHSSSFIVRDFSFNSPRLRYASLLFLKNLEPSLLTKHLIKKRFSKSRSIARPDSIRSGFFDLEAIFNQQKAFRSAVSVPCAHFPDHEDAAIPPVPLRLKPELKKTLRAPPQRTGRRCDFGFIGVGGTRFSRKAAAGCWEKKKQGQHREEFYGFQSPPMIMVFPNLFFRSWRFRRTSSFQAFEVRRLWIRRGNALRRMNPLESGIIVAFICFHRGNILIAEAIIRFPSCDHTVSTIELQANGSAVFECCVPSHAGFPFRWKPETVVNELGKRGIRLSFRWITPRSRSGFHRTMSNIEDGSPSLANPSRFHPDKSSLTRLLCQSMATSDFV